MKLAFATTFDSHNITKWSGTPFHMARAFEQQNITVLRIGGLKRHLPPYFKLKQLWNKLLYHQRESPRFNLVAAKHYSEQLTKKLAHIKMDAILAPQMNPISFFNGHIPLVLWTDALYANLLGFYSGFFNHSPHTIHQGHTLVKECLSRCHIAIFSSDWAAETAIHTYGMDRKKIKVVPFGANLSYTPTQDAIHRFLKKRSKKIIQLLFIGKQWERKGGDTVLQTAHALHNSGHAVQLHIVGCSLPRSIQTPSFITSHGFISKHSKEGQKKLHQLFEESHLLFVPSRAEAYGMVFCEANAFAMPCVTTSVGGISTIVKNNINGMTFPLETPPSIYGEYIIRLMQDHENYERLALSSFHEYQTRLNWEVATRTVRQLILDVL